MSVPFDRRDKWYTLVCGCVVMAVLFIPLPFAESGVVDDWSYTKTALDLAEQGRLIYNGWAAAMLGAQAFIGAAAIKCFGFSFLVVRLSVAPLAVGCGILLYRLHRDAYLSHNLALFGTLVILLSPPFVVNAPTFMTDIPAFFFFLLSIYSYVRFDRSVLRASRHKRLFEPAGMWGWASLGLASGVLGGTVRQVIWFVPLLSSAYLFVRYRRMRLLELRLIVVLLINSFVAVDSMMVLLGWFKLQPYAVFERVSFELITSRNDSWLALRYIVAQLIQTAGVLAIPLLAAFPFILYRQFRTRIFGRWSILGWLSLAGLGWYILTHFCYHRWIFLWLGPAVTACPYMEAAALMPIDQVVSSGPMWLWNLASIAVTISVCLFVAWIVFDIFISPKPWVVFFFQWEKGAAVVGLVAIFVAVYSVMIVGHGLMRHSFGLNDRYFILVLPLCTLTFLSGYARWTASISPPKLCWCILLLMACYGMASIHDYFSQLRARVEITGCLERQGISRTQIMAGFEYDGWTQITAGKAYNDPRIVTPSGAYRPSPSFRGFNTLYPFASYTPIVRPEYVIARAHHSELFSTDVPPVTFSSWLPPYGRKLLVEVNDPSRSSILGRRTGS